MHFTVLEGAVNEGITLILILATQLCLNKLPASIPPTPLFQLLWNEIGVMCVWEHVCGVGGEKEVLCLRHGMYVFSAPAACTVRCCWMGHFPQNPCWQKWVHFWILRWSKYYVIHFCLTFLLLFVCLFFSRWFDSRNQLYTFSVKRKKESGWSIRKSAVYSCH